MSENSEPPTLDTSHQINRHASIQRRDLEHPYTDEPITPLDRAQSATITTSDIESRIAETIQDMSSLPDTTIGLDHATKWSSEEASDTRENAFQIPASPAFLSEVMSGQQCSYETATTESGSGDRQIQIGPLTQAPFRSSDALQAQPTTSVGYEWDEWSPHSRDHHDGYASLSIDADGKGYLGEPDLGNITASSRNRLCLRIDCPSYTSNMC